MAEHVAIVLGERVDRVMARALVDAAVSTSIATGRPFKEVLSEDAAITSHLSTQEIAGALEPSAYLGVADQLVDRALAAYRAQKGEA